MAAKPSAQLALVSAWGAQASQKSNADGPRFFTWQTASDYLVMCDPLKLSEGRLLGASADAQVALRSNLLAKVSLGYEQLNFPFADGSRELNRSAYYSLDLLYEVKADLSIGADYKSGAGENRIGVMLETGHWQLNAFQNQGQNGVADNQGVMLTWRVSIPSGKQQGTLAQRMQPGRFNDSSNLLAAAIVRPKQIPKTFLAKVDPTAVTLAATISKAGLPGGVAVNSEGDVFVTVGTGSPTITGVTRNGSQYTDTALVTTTSTQVVIHSRFFPESAFGGDSYVINVTDGSSTSYHINVEGE